MLDGIRTRNPQIRSLVRYPLRHEHLIEEGLRERIDVCVKILKIKSKINSTPERFELPRAMPN